MQINPWDNSPKSPIKLRFEKSLCMGHLFALMFLNVKSETFTYSAGDMSASAPSRLGRLEDDGRAVSSVNLASRFWVMLTFQIMAYFAKMKELGPEVHLVHGWGGAEGETDGQPLRLCKLTLNRRIRRKLARMQRLGRLGMPTLRVHKPSEEDKLSPAQYMEKMIRTRKWSRVRIFGLNRGRRVPNKGGVLSFGRGAICNAILTPE